MNRNLATRNRCYCNAAYENTGASLGRISKGRRLGKLPVWLLFYEE